MPYSKSNEIFVNPYHFVSLQDACSRSIDYLVVRQQGTLTGWIDIILETLTPLFIPNTTNDNVFRKQPTKSYDFFSHVDLTGKTDPDPVIPVIPGSEIRGMIRSAFEAVTNSCLSTTDDSQVLSKRTTLVGSAGRLEKRGEEWCIIPCERFGVASRPAGNDPHNFSALIASLAEGQDVYFAEGPKYKDNPKLFRFVNDITTTANPAYRKGWFHHGEPFEKKKHHESVFAEKKGTKIIQISQQTVKNLLHNLECYRDRTVNIHLRKGSHKGYRHLARIKKVSQLDGALVYYSEHKVGSAVQHYICPAAIGRDVFHNQLSDIIESFKPCTQVKKLCPACALFGLAGKDEAAASRVRFTDALMDGAHIMSELFRPIQPLPELASPKPSATEFYLKKRGDADLWNYDFAIKWKRRPDGRITKQYSEVPAYVPTIMGRKFYWHQRIDAAPMPSGEVTDRNVYVRPLKKGVSFVSRVYFNHLSTEELKKLIWVLNIGDSSEHAHKLGMGKPVGLGSVKIHIGGVQIRTLAVNDGGIDYKISSYAVDVSSMTHVDLGCSQKVLEEFKAISNFHQAPQNVAYPCNVSEEPKVYEWFVGNKQADGVGTGTSPVIHQCLPDIRKPFLHKYIQGGGQAPHGPYHQVASHTSPKTSSKVSLGKALTGKVKFFKPEKGFGFITQDTGEEIFFHSSGLQNGYADPMPGDRVSFEIGNGQKGPQAVKVRKT